MASKVRPSPAATGFALEILALLVEIIGSDSKLREWFDQLTARSAVERRNAIYALSEKMKSTGKEPDAIVAFRLMADPRVFSAARLALCHR